MSVSTTTTTLDYTGDGVTVDFVIPFPYLDKEHVYVKVGADVDNLGAQAQGTDFTIDLEGPQGTNDGTITMTVAPANNYVVRVYRVVPLTQPTDLRAQGNFSAATHENALDRITMIAQQLNAGALVAEEVVAGAAVGSATPVASDAGSAVVGTSELSSRQDHKHSVATAAASSLTPDAANAAGVSTSLARADHHHLLATYSSTPAAIGTASAGTSGTAPARGNHVHAHGNQLGGTLHAAATSGTAGFMSAADKLKIDTLANDIYSFFDDFTGKSLDLYKWGRTLAGTATTSEGVDEFGTVCLDTGETVNSSVTLESGLLVSPQYKANFTTILRFAEVTNIDFKIGLVDDVTSTEYAWFRFKSGASPNWIVASSDGAVEESTTTSVVVTTSMTTLEMAVSDGSIDFYIDNTLKASHTTRTPGASTILRAYCYIENTVGADSKQAYVDLIRVLWSTNTTREDNIALGQPG